MINRILEKNIYTNLNKGKIIHIPGARQVGKTTLLKKITSINHHSSILWLNGDETDIRHMLTDVTSTKLKSIIGKSKFIIIDEAQRISDIGIVLKLLADNFPDVKIIATGSSAFDLANKINEPLTGRKTELFLFPISFSEMVNHTSLLEESRMLEHRMIYGYYPEVVTLPGEEKEVLKRLTDAYLYKDLLTYEGLKKPDLIEKLLQAIALQLGNQVSYNELSNLLGVDNQTVERYVNLLEKAYIIFKLPALSRNLRNELKKSRKIYFYDNGIRNALIRNFNPLSLRQDTGALWENFLISERFKAISYAGVWMNKYFWRTQAQQEIDYVEEYNGIFYAFEFKWNPKSKKRFSKFFTNAYPSNKTTIINRDNYFNFIIL
ncbi:MAG: ATP-binding protein [Chlorobi bacterium]|nr:ATP-binding protein [Chlorobiota bacterium]